MYSGREPEVFNLVSGVLVLSIPVVKFWWRPSVPELPLLEFTPFTPLNYWEFDASISVKSRRFALLLLFRAPWLIIVIKNSIRTNCLTMLGGLTSPSPPRGTVVSASKKSEAIWASSSSPSSPARGFVHTTFPDIALTV
jgi:hypothetical protein